MTTNADKSSQTHNKPFTLDGRIDLDVSLRDKMMCIPAYIKLEAPD